ncbi:DUF3568 family protein [Francisellaceae bacterium CB300]
MRAIKIKVYLSLVLISTLISSCTIYSQQKDSYLMRDGYYVENIDSNFNSVYKASQLAIESGEAYDSSGEVYTLKENKVTDSQAIIKRVSKSDLKDYLYIVIIKKDDNTSQVKIKYGSKGDSIKSSALMDMIEKSLNNKIA